MTSPPPLDARRSGVPQRGVILLIGPRQRDFPVCFSSRFASGLTSVPRSAVSWTADATPLAHLTSTADFVCRDHHTHPQRGRDTTGREFQNVPTPTNRRHPPAKMSTPSAKELAAKFEMMARENSVDSTPPPVSTSKSPSTKVLAAKFENISSTENIAPPPKSPKKETKTEAAPPPKSPAKTPPLTSPLASPPASPLRPKMAFPLGQNMANEAAWARSVEALEAGVEEKKEVPEAERSPSPPRSPRSSTRRLSARTSQSARSVTKPCTSPRGWSA